MSAEENKTIVHRFFDALARGRLDTLDAFLAPHYQAHFSGMPASIDPEDFKQFMAAFVAAFPDQHHTVEQLIAEGDTVAARLVIGGTHQGIFNGMPPTGKTVQMATINLLRLENGQIVEHWSVSDTLGMLQQLGSMPDPGAVPG